GRPVADNLLATSALARALTWVFQVLPLVFLCGGVAAAHAAGRPGWLAARVERLAAPVTAYLAVVAGGLATARVTGLLDGPSVAVAGRALAMHLWFLAAFVLVTAMVPAMLIAGRRFGWRAVPVALAAATTIDLAARRVPALGWLGVPVVWGLCTHLGVLRALGRAWPGGRRGAILSAAAALVGLVALVRWRGYPVSMVNVPGAGRSNAGPPTLAMALLGLAQAGAFTALADGWKPRRPALIVAANRVAMGAYLWQFAGILLAAVLLLATGFLPSPATGTAAWWAWRPVWLAACLVAVAAVLTTVGVQATGRPAPGRPGPVATAVALVGALVGFVLVTTSGITPSAGFAAGAASLLLARLAARHRADWGINGLRLTVKADLNPLSPRPQVAGAVTVDAA
ncbi:MAG: acyltransferase family protein, partial [Acidimicrobiales bacterium]